MEQKILNRLHEEMIRIYKEIARICDKHNLSYFVVGGTLLGAVVHKGYIPWDDDLDIAMPRDSYDRFIEICKTDLDEKFYLHCIDTDEKYWLSFAKVRMNGTVFLEEKRKNVKSHTGIYVDIFPFDYASAQNTKKHKRNWKTITYINNYIYSKTTGLKKVSKSAMLINPILSLFSVKRLSNYRDKLMKSFDEGERRYFVDLAGGRRLDNSYFLVEDILPLQDLLFGDIMVRAPKDPNKYLLQLYTERYKIIPPKEQQITHDPVLIRFEDGEEYKQES
jgi:lipopolysaccharide cholinephosphotransferase